MWRVRTVFSGIQGSPWLSTMYFFDTGGLLAQDAVTAVGAFWGAVDTFISNDVDWTTEADVSQIDVFTGQLEGVESTTPATGTGAGVAEHLPPATQALVRWRTGDIVAGRELRGRTFIPGLTESSAVDGLVATATVSDIQDAAQVLIDTVNADLGIYSRTHASIANVQSGTVWSQFAIQRSRRD